MEISIFLAKFWGWYLLIFFSILSLNPKRIKQIFFDLQDQKFLVIIAFLATIIGLVNILLHNVWETNWMFLITAIGWVSLFLGLFLFVFPDPSYEELQKANIKLVQVIYVVLFLIGFFLLNTAYGLFIY